MTQHGRIYRFRAVHKMPHLPDPWCFPHEHDYTVEVVHEGRVDAEAVDKAWTNCLADFSPADLNISFEDTSVEGLAELFLHRLGAVEVKVWEDSARWGRATRAQGS